MALWLAAFSLQAIDVTRLSCEMKDNPLALDTDVPRFELMPERRYGLCCVISGA